MKELHVWIYKTGINNYCKFTDNKNCTIKIVFAIRIQREET